MLRRVAVAFAATFVLVPATAHAQITPGVMTESSGGQCTANFIFTDGSNTLVGSAAHCVARGAATDTNGCLVESLPLGTQVQVGGATQPATLVYSSWAAMRAANENPDSEMCEFNDFALYRLSAADAGRVDSTVPIIGGPTGVGTAGTLTTVKSYQNSSLRLGVAVLSPKFGTVLLRSPEGWNYTVYTLTPGIPGDSGSGYMTTAGAAFGVLSTLAVAPFPLSNGVADLGKAMAYARAHGVPGLQLVRG